MTISADPTLARTQEIMRILNAWGINPDAQIAILGLQGKIRSRELRKYQDGLKALPSDDTVAIRSEHILGIAHALFTSYPSQSDAGSAWMLQRNGKLRGKTPIQCILQDGISGLVRVRTTLDCAWAWQQDDEHNPCWQESSS